jgi:hypothetical protein
VKKTMICLFLLLFLSSIVFANAALAQQRTRTVTLELNIPTRVGVNSIFSNKLVDINLGGHRDIHTFKVPNVLGTNWSYRTTKANVVVPVDKNGRARVYVAFNGRATSQTIVVYDKGRVIVQPTYNWNHTQWTGWSISSRR